MKLWLIPDDHLATDEALNPGLCRGFLSAVCCPPSATAGTPGPWGRDRWVLEGFSDDSHPFLWEGPSGFQDRTPDSDRVVSRYHTRYYTEVPLQIAKGY